ncbi:MAG: ABC transporter permease, partial [Planctomycetota bacterium]
FLPGVAVMIVLFTAIFATISIIEDRNEGFLQGVLVAPVPRLAIVLGKVGGGAAIAVIQAVVFLLIGPLLGLIGLGPAMTIAVTPGVVVSTLGVVVLLAVTLTALGYCLAWPSRSTQGFHALMSVFLFPMWLLSGAFFPGEEGWIRWVVSANPLTYGVAALRRSLYPAETFADAGRLPGMGISIVVTLLFGAVCVGIATWLTTRREAKNAR